MDYSKRTDNYGDDPYLNRLMKLINSCEKVSVFKHEGRMFLGDEIQAAKEFIANNPQLADFSVWLQQNYKEIPCE
jgi:hypothetical protein